MRSIDVAGELDVHVTVALPELHRAPGLFHDPLAEILIRHEEDVAVRRRGLDDLDGVAAGADDIARAPSPRPSN